MLLLQAAHLEQALLLLPFQGAQKLLEYLCIPLERGAQVELCCRVCTLLMRLHHQQLMATPQARPLMIKLQKRLRAGILVRVQTVYTALHASELLQAPSISGLLGMRKQPLLRPTQCNSYLEVARVCPSGSASSSSACTVSRELLR